MQSTGTEEEGKVVHKEFTSPHCKVETNDNRFGLNMLTNHSQTYNIHYCLINTNSWDTKVC